MKLKELLNPGGKYQSNSPFSKVLTLPQQKKFLVIIISMQIVLISFALNALTSGRIQGRFGFPKTIKFLLVTLSLTYLGFTVRQEVVDFVYD